VKKEKEEGLHESAGRGHKKEGKVGEGCLRWVVVGGKKSRRNSIVSFSQSMCPH
jgi:hypothetical protein